uniref:Putative secreted protein n=1 Tax=Anopheles triannulatus TaxID=58253 RepID=A0A2M4B6W6_9DIPT
MHFLFASSSVFAPTVAAAGVAIVSGAEELELEVRCEVYACLSSTQGRHHQLGITNPPTSISFSVLEMIRKRERERKRDHKVLANGVPRASLPTGMMSFISPSFWGWTTPPLRGAGWWW